MSIFTTGGKLLLPGSKVEIAGVICTIKIGTMTISSPYFSQEMVVLRPG